MEQGNRDFIVLISLDIETTGPKLKQNAMIELGACAINTETTGLLHKFRVDIKMGEGKIWDAACLKSFWNNTDWIKETDVRKKKFGKEKYNRLRNKVRRVNKGIGQEPKKAMESFVDWVHYILSTYANGDSKRIKFATDYSSFDVTWINYYLEEYLNHPHLHIFFDCFDDVISTTSVAQGLSRISYPEMLKLYKTEGYYNRNKECRSRLFIDPTVRPQTRYHHEADLDALYIGQEHIIQVQWGAYVAPHLHPIPDISLK